MNGKSINEIQEQSISDCHTPGKPIRTHGKGIWGGRRIVAGFRCDENVWKRFVTFSKAYYGSTCKAMESILVALMEPVRSNFDDGLTPGNTLSDNPIPILQVNEMHIHRNLGRERRNLKSTESIAWDKFERDKAALLASIILSRGWKGDRMRRLELIKEELPELDGLERIAFNDYLSTILKDIK